MRKRYKLVGLGGTFDHFHDGHKRFIEFAAQLGERLHIGVTHPKLTAHKPYANLIETPEKRVKAVKNFCKLQRIDCVVTELTDVYGPTLQEGGIEALAVTEETTDGAKLINSTRLKMRLPELPVFVSPLLPNELGEPLHSEQIRKGTINRQGKAYSTIFNKELVLNEEQRQFFAKPIGNLVDAPTLMTSSLVAVVGDYSLDRFINEGEHWDIGVFDGKQQRESKSSANIEELKPAITVNNQPGTISQDLVKKIQAMLSSETIDQTVIKVEGEEDLVTVALVLLLPLHSIIYYGQPNKELVEVLVTEDLKEKVFRVLQS